MKKLTQNQKTMLYKAERAFPETFKFMQRELNRETPLEDILYSLEQYLEYQDEIREPWAYLEMIIQSQKRKRETKRIVKKQEDWGRKKIEDKKAVADFIRSFAK